MERINIGKREETMREGRKEGNKIKKIFESTKERKEGREEESNE